MTTTLKKLARYYYTILTPKQKEVYKASLIGLKALEEEIKIPHIHKDDIDVVLNYIQLDDPLIFYVSSFKYTINKSGDAYLIKPKYKYPKQFITDNTNKVIKYLQTFDTVKAKSDFEKELYVHDHCVENFSYDYSYNEHSYTILGPVLHKTAVCQGIARFVKLALDYLGVKSLEVIGKSKNPLTNMMEGHAWNMVKLEGITYHLDVTFDMCLTTKQNRYDYFNLADIDIKKDHTITAKVPACTTTKKDYYSLESMVVNSSKELEDYIISRIKQGKKNIVLKVSGTNDTEKVKHKISEILKRHHAYSFRSIFGGGFNYTISTNPTQMVFELDL